MTAKVVPTQHLVVLGDSVAAGANCTCTTYADMLVSMLATGSGHPATLVNAGQDGLTTAGLLAQLNQPAVQRALQVATVVTITIGANDFDAALATRDCAIGTSLSCYAPQLTALPTLLDRVLNRIHQLTPATATVITTGYGNVFLDGDVGRQQGSNYVTTSDALTRAVNTIIDNQSVVTSDRYTDLYTPFDDWGQWFGGQGQEGTYARHHASSAATGSARRYGSSRRRLRGA